MGHKVAPSDGAMMGGYQALLFTPDPVTPDPPGQPPVRGVYRAGTDHRKDGQATGW
jgi:gamma-glutamyltranspeptidase/glutathione hydrolase